MSTQVWTEQDEAPLNEPNRTMSAASQQPRPSAADDIEPEQSSSTRQTRLAASLHTYRSVRLVKQLSHNMVKKMEDLAIGLLGVTDLIAEAGEGVGRTAASGVGAVGHAVEGGVASAFAMHKMTKKAKPREVDTVTEVDISGTILKDLNRAIEVERMKGTSNADSPLNTPWILMIFPILPIAFMYTKTALAIALPPCLRVLSAVWAFFGWRFWFCLSLVICLAVVIAWESIKTIEPLRPVTMQVDVVAIKFGRKLQSQAHRQMPKVHKALDKILPPIINALAGLDAMLEPKLGYSPLLALNAKLNGWIYDPKIEEIRIDEEGMATGKRQRRRHSAFAKLPSAKHRSSSSTPVVQTNIDQQQTRDRGDVMVVAESGIVEPKDSDGLEFDEARVSERVPQVKEGAGEMFEQFFHVEMCLRMISELHRKYTSVWVEWTYRDMVVDRSVVRDISTSEAWIGFGAFFDDYTLSGEVRLPLRADTTIVKGGFFDVPIKLVLKGREGLPIYANDGARRYMRNSPQIAVIGEIGLSALRIGVGTDPYGIVRSELRIPLHAVGIAKYRAAVLRASARIMPIDNSSYSYRQMLSQLPNGEWTVRVNVFELRNLRGVDDSGNSDPFVTVTVMGMKKQTDRQRKTLSCMVNQLLFFSKLCTGLEFEDEKIVIDVMDWNRFSAPKKVGVYTIDAKRILELPGRELYHKWFALQNPEGGKRPAGFIKLSINVVPPGSFPEHHSDTEDREEFSNANLLKNTVVTAPKMTYQNWAVHVTVGWADMLPRMAGLRYRDAVRGFLTFNYSGWDECRSEVFIAEAKEVVDQNIGTACRVLPQRRVIWNEEFALPLTIINDRVAQEGINLKLFHRIMPRLQEPFRQDQLIGQVSVSFEELFKNMTTAVVRGDPADGEDEGDRVREVALMKPRYYNFYGKPDGQADPYDKGIAFRGRILIGVGAKPGYVAAPFLRPCPPPPRPKLEFYKMEFSVLRATELPLPDGWSVYVEGRIGLYQFGQTIPKAVINNYCAEWDENCAVSIPNMQFPEDVEQIPDFFVTLWARKPSTVAELEERMATEFRENATKQAGTSTGRMRNAPANVDTGEGLPLEDVISESPRDFASKKGPTQSEREISDGPAKPKKSSQANSLHGSVTGVSHPETVVGADTVWSPKSFLRLPAKHLICGQQEPRWMFMDYPGNNVFDSIDSKVPGSILLSASLSRYDPTEVGAEAEHSANKSLEQDKDKDKSVPAMEHHAAFAPEENTKADRVGTLPTETTSLRPQHIISGERPSSNTFAVMKPDTYTNSLGQERSYTLRALILQGRSLPAADESGLSDPKVVVSMGDKSREGSVVCRQTVSPLWEELIEVQDIKIRDGERKPNINVLIYDVDDEDEAMQYLGRSIIASAELDTAEPSLDFSRWYPVFSVNPGVIVGELLADFQFIPTDVAIAHPMRPLPPPPKMDSALRITMVGLRDVKFLRYAAGELFVECSVSGVTPRPVRSKQGIILQQSAYEANCNILDVLVLQIEIPDDLRLAPALNLYVYAEYNHLLGPQLVATACIPLEKWLSEHHRRLLSGENLIDDTFGMDASVPERLHKSSRNYKFRRNAKLADEEPVGTVSQRLHEVKSQERTERKNMATLHERQDVLRIGFPVEKKPSRVSEMAREIGKKSSSLSDKIFALLRPVRAIKYSIVDSLADLMPDVSTALGFEVHEEVSLSSLLGVDEDKIDYDGTIFLKKERGHCPIELECDFSEPAYGEFLMFRGDNRSLGNTIGRLVDSTHNLTGNQPFPPIIPFEEVPSAATLHKRERRRAALEGARPAVGRIKARLDLIEMNNEDEAEAKKVRLTSLRSFGRLFIPTEVIVRVYILRGINLQQKGSECNSYLTARFYGGYPDFYSRKHNPIIDDDSPNFFEMFESRVRMPGGSVRIEVKDRILPEFTVPLNYPMYTNDEGQRRFGIKSKDIPVNIGRLGLGWSEIIGETVIDLDARWYNSAWRSLAKSPVETRALFSEESTNMKGQLEMFVDIFAAADVDKRPKLYKPLPISRPKQSEYELRIVVYKIRECILPYKLANNDPAKLAAFYVQARLGNLPEHERNTERCKYVADGIAEFNWRMKWEIKLPSTEVKPRLKLQVFDDTSHGIGDDQLCATVDIKLRSLFDDIVLNNKPIIKKKQWVLMEHPNYPDVEAQIQVSLELTTGELAAKKTCLVGKDGYKTTQHEDYILPVPFQPAAFSIINPVPYFNYLIVSTIKNLQWQAATVLLVFPFIPMFVQFVFMLTPWQWYAAGGMMGLMVFIRLMMVSSARASKLHAEQDAHKATIEEEEVTAT